VKIRIGASPTRRRYRRVLHFLTSGRRPVLVVEALAVCLGVGIGTMWRYVSWPIAAFYTVYGVTALLLTWVVAWRRSHSDRWAACYACALTENLHSDHDSEEAEYFESKMAYILEPLYLRFGNAARELFGPIVRASTHAPDWDTALMNHCPEALLYTVTEVDLEARAMLEDVWTDLGGDPEEITRYVDDDFEALTTPDDEDEDDEEEYEDEEAEDREE